MVGTVFYHMCGQGNRFGPVSVSALTEGVPVIYFNHITAALHQSGIYLDDVSDEFEGQGHRSKVGVTRLGNVIFGQLRR